MSTTRKFLRNMDKVTMSNLGKATKLQKVVSTVTAMGFVLQPVAAMAQIVTDIKPVGNGASVEANGNVTNIWAGTVVNDVALNVFKKFDIGANDIANMYFHEKNGSKEANNLVNMVGSKININGTVNAIQNSKIGGNLYFLSSNGIAVGAGGVVNAGSLTLMTPSDRFMKSAMAAAGTDGVLTDATNAVINIFDDNYKVDVDTFKNSYLLNNWNKFQQMEVAMNKTGTITVNGTINTINGIRMKAAHINIGKEVDENGKLTGKNATAKAVLNSGIVDFSNIVNINNVNSGTIKNALGNDLKAEMTGDGNIVLAAVANTVNVKDDYGNFMSQNVQGYNSVQATVDIGNAELKAVGENAKAGAIDISATATAGGEEGHFLGVDIVDTNLAEILGSKISKADAKINIDGTLTADTINIAAVAENTYDEEATTNVGTLKDYVKDIGLGLIPAVGDAEDALGLDVDVSYAKLASNAEVTIGEKANLTATGKAQLEAEPNDDNEDSGWRQGGALNISAISKLEANVGAEVESEGNEEAGNQGKAAGGATGTNKKKNNNTLAKVMPNAGIAIVDTDNKATVTVRGTLKAEHGDANVSASAVNSVEAASGVTAVADKATGAESNYINAAVTVANIKNASNVEITGTTTVGGELNALAKSSSEVTTGASAGSDKNALLNSAINVTDASSTADLVIGGTLTADKMNLAAENTISNEMQAINKLGETKREVRSKMGQGTLNKIFGNAGKKVKKGGKVDKIGNYFSAGAAVNVVDETNKATVTVKRGANLTAKNNGLDAEGNPAKDKDGNIIPTINISANNTIEDSFMSATSVINNYTGGKGNTSSSGNVSTGTSSNTAAMASAAVLSADMDNSAQVIIEGSDDQGASAPVIKGAHVNINANSAFEYDRLGSMIESLKEDYNDILEKYKDVLGDIQTLGTPLTEINKYLSNPSVDGAMDVAESFQNAVDTISLAYVDIPGGIPEDLNTMLEDVLAFIDVSNYSNFYTAASTAGGNALGKAGGSGAGSGQAKVAATGSINLNSIKNNAQVVVGKGAQIEANGVDNKGNKVGELNISATAKQHDVALNGKTKYFIPKVSNTSGGATAIGGSVGVHDADVNSLVVIGEGATLSGNDVNLKAENDLQHTAITFGGGKATNDGITGMFAYMEGESNSIISVDDEASINAANKLALNANNDTNISNIIFDRTSAGNSAVGASIGIIDYGVNNIAAIADNDSDATRGENEEVKELVGLVQNQLSDDEKAQLGTKIAVKGEANGKGKIEANTVEVNAATTGTITGVSVAGTTAGATQQRGQSSTGGFKLPAQIAGAGSGSANYISGNTAALLEGVDVTTIGTNGDVKVSASDDSMISAYSGAAALKKKGRQASSGGFSATLAGAVAYNNVNTGVTAQIKDASIKNAAKITNIAAREGAVVAAGLALGVDTSGQGAGSATSINAGVSASINEINNSTHAVMNNVTTSISGGDGQVPANTDIDNIAQSKDIQVAGGITAQYAKGGGIGIGAAVSSLHATNDIQAKITGSTLKNVGNLKAYAASDLVQVGTAISAGVIQGQNGNGVQAAVADNQLTNNVGVTINGGEITANSVDAKAFDGKVTTSEAANKHLKALNDEGFDVDGADAMADVNASQANVSVDKNKVGGQKTGENGQEQGDDGKTVSDFNANENSGNLIVSGAASIIANTSTQGKVTAGAASVNQTINNNFTVDITNNANITADTVQAKAESDTLMVGVAAGVAVSTGQQGAANLAGSVGVMQLNNNTKTTIENSEITAKTIKAKAETKSRLINVAGQVSASKGKVAAGLATATNILNNTTGAYVYGSTIKGKDGEDNNTSLTVEADNNSKAYAVAVGVAAQVGQQGAALSGDVAVNKGKNNTEAIVGKRENGKGNTITNVDDININVLGNTTLNAISGGVTASTGNAGLGGAVAYNEVGNGDNDKQNTIAKLTDTVITTDKATTIDVNAVDSSHMLAFAVGAAVQTGQTGAAAQGSAATTILHKNVEAAVSNVNIDEHKDGETDRHNAALNVIAQNTSEAITSADVVAISTANFAGGAAVAVTNSDNDTKASITGGNMNLKSGKVEADSNVDIINIGISAAVATGQGGSIAGNVAVNNIKNDTIASIDNATMNATGTIGVLANSKEHIRNYAGALSATVGQGYAAGGLSTAVNVISGNTSATVTGSTITANGDDNGVKVTEYAKDKKDNKEKTLTGFVVNADSAHEIDNVVVTGGVAITAEAAVAASGTVAVNSIQGTTVADVENTDINADATDSITNAANVNVRANDNTEINSHVGSAAVAGSANAGVSVGEASDSNIMNRQVTAQIVGNSTNKNKVNANNLTVNAFNKHDILSNSIGIAAAGGAYAGVGVAGTTSVLKTTAGTTANVANITSKNNGMTINAAHVNKVQLFGNSAVITGAIGGASVGAAIAVLNDGSKTEAKLSNSQIEHYSDNTADDIITAKNDTDILSEAANAAVSASIGAGVSGVITVNNMDNAVYTTVENSNIGEESKQAKSITVKADNKLKTQFASGTGSAGLGAAGVGIGINTIDTSVVTDVKNSNLYANDVTLFADEERSIAQTAVSAGIGGIAANASVLVTNIGTAVSDKYGVDSTNGFNGKGEETDNQTVMSESDKVDISSAYKQTETAISNQDNVVGSDKKNTVDTLGNSGKNNILGDSTTTKDADGKDITLTMDSGLTNDKLQSGVTAGRGGKTDAQGVKVNVSNSAIKVTNKVDIKADTTTNANITVGNGSAAAVAVGATVGMLNVKRNSGVNITKSTISAGTIDVNSNQDGEASVKVYQGGLSGAAVNVVYSGVHLSGQNDIILKGATLQGNNGVSVTTNDTSTANLETIGVSGALTSSANIFVVDGKNESSSTITVDKDEENKNSEIKAENGDVVITAKHGRDIPDASSATGNAKDNLDKATNAYNSAVAAYDSAKSAYDSASDSDKASKMEALQAARNNLTEAEFNLQKAQQQAKIEAATEKATMTAKIIPVAVAGVASGLGFNAKVEDSSQTNVIIGAEQKFTSNKTDGKVDIKAINNSVNKVSSVTVNAALGAAIGATGVQAKGNAGSMLTVGNNNVFEANNVNLGAEANVVNDAKITAVGAGFGSFMVNWATANAATEVNVNVGDNLYKATNVNISGKSDITQRASATGLIAGMYTSGTNLAKVDARDVVNVTAGGNKAESNDNTSQNNVKITAEGVVNQLADSNGYGGAYVDVSPAAAITKSNINSATTANVTGNWKVDTIDVNAKHDNVVDLDTDAVKAAVVGLSGVWAYNDVVNNTNLNLTDAVITANSDINAKALNDISYRNKIWAGGYGAVAGNALIADDDITLNAKVNVTNSNIKSNKAIDIEALAGGVNAKVNKKVTIKSAGVVAGSLGVTNDDLTISNAVIVDKNSALATVGSSGNEEQNNIVIEATDKLDYKDVATANTQGGVVGAASTKLDAKFNRTNTITINGKVDSNYDATFNAGGNSIMNVTLRSNAYNKTAAPIVANPGLDYKMRQTNTVVIGDNGTDNTVQTVRNINLIGDAGDTTVVTETKSWKWTEGGETGTGSIASTADGTQSKNDELNNGVQVDGKLLAGKNSKLDITITDDGKQSIDGTDGALEKYLKDKLNAASNSYDEAQKEYDSCQTTKDLIQASKDLQTAEDAKVTANIYVNKLNKLKGDVNTKESTMNEKQNTLLNEAGKIYYELIKQNIISASDDDSNKPKVESKEAFAKLDNSVIEGYMKQAKTTENNATKDTYDSNTIEAFLNVKKEFVDAESAYSTANNTLGAQVKSAGTLVELDSNTKQYKVSGALDTKIRDLESKISNYEKDSSYMEVKKKRDNALADYNKALSDATTNDTLNGELYTNKDDFINESTTQWFKDQNNGSAVGSLGFKDYAAALVERLHKLEELVQVYNGSASETTFKNDLRDTQAELIALGLGYYEQGSKDTLFVLNEGASNVPTVELKDIFVTGGNINVTGGSLSGKGTLKATGNPEINITNNSKYYLRVNDIKIGNDGGNVKLNGTSISGKYGDLTVDATPAQLVKDGDKAAKINITANSKVDGRTSQYYTPDIGIFGNIYNPYGLVQIKNETNSIYVAGKSDSQNGGSIHGAKIILSAPKGSITQGYNDGIVNIAGDPNNKLALEVIKKIQAKLIEKLGFDMSKFDSYYTAFKNEADLKTFLKSLGYSGTELDAAVDALLNSSERDKEHTGMNAAGSIFINAANININGVIQSGYDTIKMNVDQSTLNNVLKKEYSGFDTEDSKFMSDEWLVTASNGVEYDKVNKKYVYNVKAWYNPTTGQIFTEDIDQSGGGRIYLTAGKIASTGGGKLIALDGGANINIDNLTTDNDKTLKIGSINADRVEGKITIVDKLKGTTTEYTRSNTGDSTKYQPKEGLMYIWTQGTTNQVVDSYRNEFDSKWFGLDKDEKTNLVNSVDKVLDKHEEGEERDTLAGDVINTDNLGGNHYTAVDGSSDSKSGNIYQVAYERSGKIKQGTNEEGKPLFYNTDGTLTTENTGNPYYLYNAYGSPVYESEVTDYSKTTKKKGLLGLWGKKVTVTWKEKKGMLTSYNYGLKADNPIDIKFIGNKDGGVININSNSDVLLGGDIRANDVTIKSNNGSITTADFGDKLNQKTIFTDNLKLTAAQDITALQQSVGKALNLVANSTNGSVNMKMMAGITDSNIASDSNLASGNVFLDNVSAGKDLTLEVEGSVLNGTRPDSVSQNASNTASAANKIKYTGKLILKAQGNVGTDNGGYLVLDDNPGTVNVSTTKGNIYLKQDGSNEMKLGQIITNDGDVYLNADGGFIDAIENNSKLSESDTDRIQAWKDQGILGGKSAQDQYNEQVKDLEDQAKSTGVLGDNFKDKTALDTAGEELIKAGQVLTDAVKHEYQSYYDAHQMMIKQQAELNEAISAKNNGDASKYDKALSEYNYAFAKYAQAKKTYEDKKASVINAYVTDKGYVDAEKGKGLQQKTNVANWLANYEELTHGTEDARLAKYGWTENQLLYAIQDSIINPSAGSVADVNNANIIANNIHLTTAKGNLGRVDDTQKTVISLDDMSKMFNGDNMSDEFMKKMNKLAGARADDVTWGTKNITVERTTPISVKLNSDTGTVSIDAPNSNNIYLIGKDSKLNLEQVVSKGDVRLTGQKGIDASTIIGSNISLEGGSGSIGSSTKAVLAGLVGTNANGKINANAAGDIWLTQLTDNNLPNGVTVPSGETLRTDMVLGSLAGKNITITASGNIVSGNDKVEVGNTTETKGISYINASKKLTLVTAGSVGEDGNGLRIKNSDGLVEIDAQNGAYLEAKGDGTLVLGTIKTGTDASDEFVVNSEGSLSVGREADTANNVTAVEGSIIAGGEGDAKANVTLTTAKDLTFSGKVRANELTAQSYAGDITQTTTTQDKNIEVNKLNVSAIAGNIKLANEHNVIKDINIEGLGGALDLVVSMDALNLNLGSNENALSNNYGGDFKIKNNKGNINVKSANTNIYGNIELEAAKNITVKRADEDTNSKLELNTNKLDEVLGNGDMLQPKGNITLTAGENIENNGTLTANAANVEGAEANIILNAKSVTNKNALIAKSDIDIDASAGNITNNGTAKAGQNVDLNASGNVENNAKVEADKDVSLVAGANLTNNAEINAGNDTKLNANNTIYVKGNITSGGSISGTTENGSITIDAAMKSDDGGIKLETKNANAKADIIINGTLQSNKGNIDATTKQGDINFNGNVTVDEGSVVSKVGTGNVSFKDSMITNIKNGNIENAIDEGNVNINGVTNITTGDIRNKVTEGNVNFNGATTISKGHVTNKVEKGDVEFNNTTDVTTGDVNNIVGAGDVRFNGVTSVGNGSISTTVDNGNIDYNAETNVNTGNIYTEAKNGNIDHDANMTVGTGNITDKASGTINSQDKGKLETINGSIDIDAGGDINLAEVIATNGNADINSANGSIYLRKVNGKNVILIAKKNILTDETYADKITTNGDDITLNISQENGLVIDELLANTVTINKAKGSLDIEKMAIENEANFNVNGMTTTVWGRAPERKNSNGANSDSIYWFNLNAWKNGGDWMNLVFSNEKNFQSSNGNLLSLRDYFYVYNQRFTAIDHLNQLLDENKADEYDINFNPEVVHYFRHDLYDLDEREQQEHADPSKIVIEA